MVKKLSFFPTPYPDEIFYSTLSRYWLRCGCPAPRSTTEELYGIRTSSSVLTPHYLSRITSLLPAGAGLTSDYFINNTTVYPYFHPFLPAERGKIFLAYMKASQHSHDYFSLGMGKMRRPKTTCLRFCRHCWLEEQETYGEPYWKRLHQLPGVLICPNHRVPLLESPISLKEAQTAYYPASLHFVERSICTGLADLLTEKLLDIARDSQWVLTNGWHQGPYEDTYARYVRSFYFKGLGTQQGQLKQKEINIALFDYFGAELLKLMGAYDEGLNTTWTIRIPHILHPLFHILLMELLAGSASCFFQQNCPEILPFGPSPWPCHNPVCPGYLKDVIKHYVANPYAGCMHAEFECPICGMVYHRKKAMCKDEQYYRRPKITNYGPLWEAMLKECLENRRMTARKTSQKMGCDFYTVNRHALALGILSRDEVYLLEKAPLEKAPAMRSVTTLSEQELRGRYRNQWLNLIKQHPDAGRSQLIQMPLIANCYKWLRKYDTAWYEENSPPTRRIYFDWIKKDMEALEILRKALKELLEISGRPRWITRSALIRRSGLHQISNRKTLARMPSTDAFLKENLESREEWQKRKIIWAVKVLQAEQNSFSPQKVLATASISAKSLKVHNSFIEELLCSHFY